jgi:hypothetical protein
MFLFCRTVPGKSELTPLRFVKDTPKEGPRTGVLRDSAHAAWLSAMFADLLGVTPKRTRLARCMAWQTLEFILGKNAADLSFQVGMGAYVLHVDRDFARADVMLHGLN